MATFLLQLDILRELREEVGLTQDDMARLCGLQGQKSRQTAGAWERGDMIPSRSRRARFIGYLWDHLRLRNDPARFESVWEILMGAWGWEAISDKEWEAFTSLARPPRENAFEQKLEQIEATLSQLQSGKSDTFAKSDRQVNRPTPILVQLPLDTLPEAAPLPAGSRMLLGRNPLFVGRRRQLLALAAAFSTGSTSAISQLETAAATGLGGIGKTQLASEFVHRYGQFFHGGVFWLSFDNEESISSEMAACGGAGALELRPDFATRSLEEQVRLVQAAFQEPIPRLLVFDNCEDSALLARWRPTSGGCRVLVTSRCLEWELALGVQLHALDVLSREESLQLLQKHKLNTSLDVLDAIATELGDLPLALHLAGSYLYRYRRVLTAEQYLAYLRDPALLDHPSLQGSGPSPTGHVQHVARTFALSFDRLDPDYQLDARARQILVHVALLAPGEPVPYDLLAETLDTDLADAHQAVMMEEAIVRLLELGLIDVNEERQVWIHRLVASFVRGSAADAWQEAQPRVEATIQRKLYTYYQSVMPLPLLPIQTHLRHVVEVALQRQDAASATMSLTLARYLRGLGDLANALRYSGRALAIRQRVCGLTHDDTAASHHLIGMLHQTNGDFEQAHHHLQKALDIRLKLFGENDFRTADTLSNIGDLLWSEQRNQEAIATLGRALKICDEAVEEDHPLVAEITMALGLCMLDGGFDVKVARHYMEEAVRIRHLKLGENHPYTALVYTNMGYFLHQIGELENAARYYQQGLVIREKLLGKQHVDTVNSIYCLGRLRRQQERWDEAESFLEQVLAVFLSDGQNMIPLAACLNELGAVALGKGELALAHRYIEEALAIRQRIFGADHPHVANTRQNLGQVLFTQGEMREAEAVLLQTLRSRQQAQDPENMRVAETLLTLGQVAESRGDLNQAHDYYSRCLAIHTRHLGTSDPLTRKLVHIVDDLTTRIKS